MSRITFIILFLFTFSFIQAQKAVVKPAYGQTFWKEDFSGGKLPTGWQFVCKNDSTINWTITDQPFPGSYAHSQQAPPIASKSRGFHLQYSPGVKVDRAYKKWKKNNAWADAYVESAPIDCSTKRSVVLKFQQNFMWNNFGGVRPDAGLFVGVSSDGKEWKEYDVRNNIGSEDDCPNPMNVELNITKYAAGQKTVYLRFYWKGMYAWYWMVDDIELQEALEADLTASELVSHKTSGNKFTTQDVMSFKIINLGAENVIKNFDCFLQIDKREPVKTTVTATKDNPFKVIDTLKVSFPAVDLTDVGIHRVKFYTALPEDKRTDNDTIKTTLFSSAYSLGEVTGFNTGGNEFKISCHKAQLKVIFYRDDIFRFWMSYDGEFTNPPANDIVNNTSYQPVSVKSTDKGSYYLITTPKLALRAYKFPLRFALYRPDNTTLIWEETKGMTYGEQTVQYLKRADDEYFYGGGQQNGRFSHRGQKIKMNIDYNWEDGGNPNPAPFFMSNKGYGALRNTYTPGEYNFQQTVTLSHDEPRFDCYYFVGNTLQEILGLYTDMTGKPFLPPRWALSMGDANCYNRGAKPSGSNTSGKNGTTPDVIKLIADEYIKHDMPRGWILPNDGYGCGYTKLDSVVKELHKRGFYTGLWTESGVDKIAREVGEMGTRLCKLDVAWVGAGYKFALDGVKTAYDGIENSSDARGFVWSVCGWAGSQRHSVLWTGDQSGSWNYIRWHIPTLVGSGLSGQNYATGDVDGIFGGSDSTYTRDLQWKCFTPVFMGMSGWATNNKNHVVDKQPWLFGEPFTSINRKYLKLKQRLTPYMYTLCNEAFEKGVPTVRGMMLEFPQDTLTYGEARTKYQFMLGKFLLVAPVYKSEGKRDGIYFPEGKWFDYWSGESVKGGQTLNNYPAPLDKLPLFVRGGAIIPLYPQMMFDAERPADTLTLDIYPSGKSNFTLYEDDGLTREHRKGSFSKQLFECEGESDGTQPIAITINSSIGEYKGKPTERVYSFQVHSVKKPSSITADFEKSKLKKFTDKTKFDASSEGWYFDPTDRNGVILIKTKKIALANKFGVKINF